MSSLETVRVLLHYETTDGFNGPGGLIPADLPTATLAEALRTCWPDNLWAASYNAIDREGNFVASPRLNKPSLAWIRSQGGDVILPVMFADIDNPNHTPWESLGVEADFDTLSPAAQVASAIYTTRAGVRLVYVLDKPATVEEYMAYMPALGEFISKHEGMPVDDCNWKRWNQGMRLPRVVRDGVPQWDQTWFKYRETGAPPFAFRDVLKISGSTKTALSERSSLRRAPSTPLDIGPMPHASEISASALARVHKEGWCKALARDLNGEDWWDYVFGDLRTEPMAKPGDRHAALTRVVGTLCNRISRFFPRENQRQHAARRIFMLVFSTAYAMQAAAGDERDSNFLEQAWRMIGDFLPKEYGALEYSAERVFEAVREWAPDATEEWVARRAVVCVGSSFMVLSSDGTYHPTIVRGDVLISHMDHAGTTLVVPTTKQTKDGMAPMTKQDILNRYSFTPPEIVYCAGKARATLDSDGRLLLATYRKDDSLIPEYDTDVDEWLSAFIAHRADVKLWIERWIASALAIDLGPTCALALSGPAGSGKQLFACGLAECFQPSKRPVPFEIALQRFNHQVTRNPIVLLNEGYQESTAWHYPPASLFRSITAGDPILVEEKYGVVSPFAPCSRFVYTANNVETLYRLLGSRDLSQADREAILLRVRHIALDSTGTRYLASKGNRNHTRGWIAPSGDGTRSSYRVAKHFLYLAAKHREEFESSKGRLLMEGTKDPALSARIMSHGYLSAGVLEAVIALANEKDKPSLTWHESGVFWFTMSALQQKYLSTTGKTVSANMAQTILMTFDQAVPAQKRRAPSGVASVVFGLPVLQVSLFAAQLGVEDKNIQERMKGVLTPGAASRLKQALEPR